ncbi:phage portal protein family protein [Halonotius roseus]|uniref:Phage portal protein n=1 Tax=Halonotius roseus TaxID=2511997 RepID=A0A544QQZ5_9EURY|nr:portal protein [Halonotius roseus]TQQ81862.1 phage portal protein [Halonotius roseus]
MGTVKDEIQRRASAGDLPGQQYPGQFALDSPKAVVKQAGGQGGKPRVSEAPEAKIQEYRLIADTDPHVGEAIDTLVDFLVGSGYNITPANVVGTDENQTDEDIADLKALVETSNFEDVLFQWIWHALVDGTGFLEVVVEDDVFKPKVLPTEQMEIQTDEFGDVQEYILETEGGDDIPFEPYELSELKFHSHPGEDFGRSLIERCEEQADMLRDMEIDNARFIATKAYPPVIWKLGSDDRPWSQDQIDGWLDTVSEIEPDSMLAVGHDVDHDVVGVSSTSSSAGAMRLEPVFNHLLQRIYTALGVPAFLGNVDSSSGNEAVATMPKFDRRIQKYRSMIRSSIRHQLFVSILAGDSDPAEADVLPPQFEFGEHSSEEERLDADMAIKLVNNGLLTFEAAAKRIGIDSETELPGDADLAEHIRKINQLAGKGDEIQRGADGGRPTNTGGGAQSAGREAKTRDNPDEDNSGDSDRPKQSLES